MSFSTSLRISGSALTAQRLRMDVIAGNVANVETTRGEDGGPYRKREVVLQNSPAAGTRFAGMGGNSQALSGGVRVAGIVESDGVKLVSNPSHPDADENGFVAYPDIDIVDEMTNMMSAVRAYEASVTVANSAKQMATKALEIGRA